MCELVIVEMGDIHSDLVLLTPEILGEVVDRLSGGLGVKLGVQRVPVWLGRGENTDNIIKFGNTILHFKPKEFDYYEFHCFIGVISAMYASLVPCMRHLLHVCVICAMYAAFVSCVRHFCQNFIMFQQSSTPHVPPRGYCDLPIINSTCCS